MTLQTMLYFTSILLTCGLTGFLAWYAWRQPPLPGARAYAVLAFSECLMALTDVISMLSGTQAQALLWFNLRFIFTATIPVIFLAFALEYNGHKGWFSKKLLAGALVIPFMTQVLLWSNSLHGLWVKQEVAFHRNGPFWIAETGARIPGLWFLVHSFYSQIFMLAGMVLIFLAAWRMRRQYRGQALLLIAGALVGLVGSLIPTFNLIPQAKFNPFIPGIGISALFYALAIFRFQFLKRAPAQEGKARSVNLKAQEKDSLAVLIFIFILFASGIAAVGYLTYRNYEKQYRVQVDSQLSSIADLKVSGLENWRAERMADAEVIHHTPTFAALVQISLENPGDAQARADLQVWLDTIRNSYRYDRIFLLDTAGIERVASPATPEPVAAHLTQEAAAVIHSGQVTFLDFHRDSPEGKIHLALLVPIYVEGDPSRPLGLLVLRIDPNVYLYPYINQWPGPSITAETLLIRREGNEALYLNGLKFEQNAALNLRIPLEDTEILAVKAALGQTGIVEGLDYRGQPVIGYVCAVPGSPWLLVARMDAAEVYAPLRARAWQSVIFFGVLILASGAGLLLIWRQQRVRYYRAQLETAESLRKSQDQYRELVEHASDGIFIADASGKYVEVNPSGCAMLGYTRDELLSKRISDMVAPEDMTATPLRLDELRQGKTLLTERHLIRKDGSLLPVEISGRMLPDGRFQSITRDITERVRAEEELRKSEAQYRLLAENMSDTVWLMDMNLKTVYISPSVGRLRGFTLEEINSVPLDQQMTPESLQRAMMLFAEALSPENLSQPNPRIAYSIELEFYRKDGSSFWSENTFTLILDSNGQPVNILGSGRDITERKHAEEKLAWEQYLLSAMLDNLPDHIYFKDRHSRFTRISKSLAEMFGLHNSAEMLGKTDFDFFTEEHAQSAFEIEQNIIATGQPVIDLEEKETWSDGRVTWVNTTKMPLLDQAGNIIGTFGSSRNITERKQAEEKLAASEVRYRRLFETARDGILILDAETGMILEVNQFMIDLLGFSREVFLGRKLWELGFFKDIASNKAHFLELQQKEYIRYEDLPLETVNGQRIQVEFVSNVYQVDHRRVMQCNIRDITERKHAEARLIDSDIRYRRLFEAARDGILILEAETGVVVDVNPFLVEMLGFPKEKICGKELWELGFFKDIAVNKANFLELQQKEYIRYENLPLETAQGQWLNVEFVSNVYQVDHHRVIQCNIRDITDRKRVEQQLANYTEKLEEMVGERTRELRDAQEQIMRQERLAMLGQLAGSIGHELRNPLGVISNAVYFLKMAQPEADDIVKEYLNIIENEARTSNKIVTDLLDFTRIKSVDREPASVSELVQQTLERYPVPPSVQVALEIPTDLPLVHADPQHIVQVLGNLTVNACQAMNDIGQLTLSASAQGDMIAIAVQDTGEGIPPENMSKLFEPLFTTKTKGIGLGLAVSQKLAEANGGRIEVQSEPGAGSTFTLVLPVYEESK